MTWPPKKLYAKNKSIATLFLTFDSKRDCINPRVNNKIKIVVPNNPYLKKKSKKSIEALVNQNSPLFFQNKFCPEKLVPNKKVFEFDKDSFI